MFGISRRRRLKVQLTDSPHGTRSPLRHPKKINNSVREDAAPISDLPYVSNRQSLSTIHEILDSGQGCSDCWMVLPITGDKPPPRCNHAAAVVGNKMLIVGGEYGSTLLDDVQVLDFEKNTWEVSSSKLHIAPDKFQLKIPACKGHCLISSESKVLLIGGKTDPVSSRLSVWTFDMETECWSLMEAKGDIPTARSGHTVVKAGSVLILFGGEDSKNRKLNDLHMFDLKSSTWLPLSCIGPGPSPRSNHVAALYDGSVLFVFGGISKSKALNDIYSLDFGTMAWSRIKVQDFHPSPRAGCCGVLHGAKWYIVGGGCRKKRFADVLVFDVLKLEWAVTTASSMSSVATNKGFSLVLLQHDAADFLVAFGGSKKEPSNEVEMLDVSANQRRSPNKGRSSSETTLPVARNISLQKAASHGEVCNETASRELGAGLLVQGSANTANEEEVASVLECGVSEDFGGVSVFQVYEARLAALVRKNGVLEGQLSAAQASREMAERSLASAVNGRQEMEKKLSGTEREMELLKEKLVAVELAKEEAHCISSVIHADNIRLEHDVTFLKAALDDTQKELQSTRAVVAGERARTFQMQVELFHLKQRLQAPGNRTTTPKEPFEL